MPKTGTHRKTAKSRSGLKIKRYVTVDALRGLAVLLMIFISALYLVANNIPTILLHNQGDVFLPFDIVAPIFQFVLGMSLFLFILHRKSHGFGKKEITNQLMRRYLLLILLGFVLDAVTYASFKSWGVLETLGVGGIIALLVADRTNNEKILISILILSINSLVYSNPVFYSLTSMPHAGPAGALPYSVLTILGFMAAGKLYNRRSDISFFIPIIKSAVILLILGLLLSFVIPFNKAHASPSFILFSGGIVVLLYSVFFVIYKTLNYTFDSLRILGKNALTIWVVQYMFVWLLTYVLQKVYFLDFIPGLLASIGVTAFMYLVAVALNRTNIKLGL